MAGDRVRYASGLGPQYALPIEFDSLRDAVAHKAMCDRLLTGLPGHSSMRIELWDGEEWCEADL